MPGVDHQAEEKGAEGVEGRGQQGDGHILHAAAEGEGADKARPQKIVALGGHQQAVGQTDRQIAGEDGHRVGERRLQRGGEGLAGQNDHLR